MTFFETLSLVIALVLIAYLLFALVRPEKF